MISALAATVAAKDNYEKRGVSDRPAAVALGLGLGTGLIS